MLKVFVYGTLKPGEANYQFYCAGKVVEEVKAYTNGQLFALRLGYPAMTKGDGKVEGYLLSFADVGTIAILDELEDYKPERSPDQNEYYRQLTVIYDLSGEPLDRAWAYFMLPDKVRQLGGVLLRSGWWTSK